MPYHHVAIATTDIEATHRFYTEAMGFELVKVQVGPTPEGGWSRHVFYDTGDGTMIAFWDLHDPSIGDFNPGISVGLGLPEWVNHLAFAAADTAELDRRRQRWLDQGHDVVEVDHGWCRSIYTRDPNGILVEWCTSTRAFTPAERREAAELLRDPAPPLEPPGAITFHRATTRVGS